MTAVRLPGIYFRTEPPPEAAPLPRMDVAGFVGLAQSGPLDVPVLVEDAGRFRDVFGGALRLARDPRAGGVAESLLAPTVRAFFRDGGRRCWVVRVAGESAAASRFAVPGLLRADGDGGYLAVAATARSEGTWADDLTVNATLGQRAPTMVETSPPADHYRVSGAAPGDLVRVECVDGPDARGARWLGFFAVPGEPGDERALRGGVRASTLETARGAWFRAARADDVAVARVPGDALAPRWLPGLRSAERLVAPPGAVARALHASAWGVHRDRFVVAVGADAAAAAPPGTWVRLDIADVSHPSGSRSLLLPVDAVEEPAGRTDASPPADERWLRARQGWWVMGADEAAALAPRARSASVLELEVWVRTATGDNTRLAGLGFTPAHARYVGALPSDRLLFDAAVHSTTSPFVREVSHPRFPLAMRDAMWSSAPADAVFLPLGVPGVLRDALAQPREAGGGSAAERDGVTAFSPSLFVDPDLDGRTANVDTLLPMAFEIENPSGGERGRALRKLHALLAVDEVSILAVPDAVDWGWERVEPDVQRVLAAPDLALPSGPDAGGCLRVSWSVVPGADAYELEQSPDALFTAPSVAYRGVETVAACVRIAPACPARTYFRARALGTSGHGAWSVTRACLVPDPTFGRCEQVIVESPELLASLGGGPAAGSTRVRVEWTLGSPGADRYVVEESGEPAFSLPRTVYEGTGEWEGPARRSTSVWRLPGAPAYYRARAVRGGVTSAWSNTAAVPADGPLPGQQVLARGDLERADAAPGLWVLEIHRAMLRFCAARSDVFALLSLPAHYREDAALSYRRALSASFADENPARTLSFGALYHPWPVVREEDGGSAAVRLTPPDGPVAGTMAARTLAVGAWAPPANRALRGVVALEPPLAPQGALRFFDAQFNQLRETARGFRVMSEETLSPDADLREINVRRLLILVRRLVLREGADDVFAPNDDSFRRLVQRRFEDVMGRLFVRGAFAGVNPDEGFRVVTGGSLNTPQGIDQGRFIVELRIAPARPLAFIDVRLALTSRGLSIAEGL